MHTSYMMCNCCLKDKQYDLRFLRFCKRLVQSMMTLFLNRSLSTPCEICAEICQNVEIHQPRIISNLIFRATLQFCFLKPPMAIVTIILATKGLYSEGNWDPTQGKFYKISLIKRKIIFLP